MIFKQRNFLSTYDYEITESGVNVKFSSPLKSMQFTSKFEETGTAVIAEKSGKRGWLYGSIVLFLLAVFLFFDRILGGDVEAGAELFYAFIGAGCFVVYYISKKDCVYLTGEEMNTLEFFRDKPSEKEVTSFIEAILDARKKYLKAKYAKVDVNLPSENQIYLFKRLLDEEIINEEEFNQLKDDLENATKGYKQPVGFATN